MRFDMDLDPGRTTVPSIFLMGSRNSVSSEPACVCLRGGGGEETAMSEKAQAAFSRRRREIKNFIFDWKVEKPTNRGSNVLVAYLSTQGHRWKKL